MFRGLRKHSLQVAKLILHTCEVIKKISDETYIFLKQLLISPTWKYSHYSDMEQADLMIKNVEDVEGEFHVAGS